MFCCTFDHLAKGTRTRDPMMSFLPWNPSSNTTVLVLFFDCVYPHIHKARNYNNKGKRYWNIGTTKDNSRCGRICFFKAHNLTLFQTKLAPRPLFPIDFFFSKK